ncbi:ExbD/TolR family protein [Teredinibacter haidensis]|uniref:ExbD/TolR family protein n=1 Tax=Teredinibacter haidensis TaxID=2731755 RepID=UPI0009490881|nr:biopolymer transporter ExbD [Teredinibacter haidensis]
MSALGSRRKRTDPDVEINMVPIMNMFLVLIPFLLMSSSFLNLKAIDASVPVRSESSVSQDKTKESDIVVTAVIKLNYKEIRISVTSDELTEIQLSELDKKIEWKKERDDKMVIRLSSALQNIKAKYPKSNTIILSPGDDVVYEDIVNVMDVARTLGDQSLFPIVVVSGEVSSG